jgi:hypothetical protein
MESKVEAIKLVLETIQRTINLVPLTITPEDWENLLEKKIISEIYQFETPFYIFTWNTTNKWVSLDKKGTPIMIEKGGKRVKTDFSVNLEMRGVNSFWFTGVSVTFASHIHYDPPIEFPDLGVVSDIVHTISLSQEGSFKGKMNAQYTKETASELKEEMI